MHSMCRRLQTTSLGNLIIEHMQIDVPNGSMHQVLARNTANDADGSRPGLSAPVVVQHWKQHSISWRHARRQPLHYYCCATAWCLQSKLADQRNILKQLDVVPLLELSNLCAPQLKAMSHYLTNNAQFQVVHAESARACTKSCHFTVACHVEFGTASCFASIVKVYARLVEKATVRAMG